jgi:hypothetical protein
VPGWWVVDNTRSSSWSSSSLVLMLMLVLKASRSVMLTAFLSSRNVDKTSDRVVVNL